MRATVAMKLPSASTLEAERLRSPTYLTGATVVDLFVRFEKCRPAFSVHGSP